MRRYWRDYLAALWCVLVGIALVFGGMRCTPTQRTIASDAADVAHATCILLLDLGAPEVIREVCEAEQDVYPLVDSALSSAERAPAAGVACPAAPEAAPVLAVRRVGGRAQAPILLRDRAVLKLVVSRSGQDGGEP